MAEDFTRRFTGRAPFYSTSRPSYPMRILDILRTEIGFDRTFVVADVGSGTGLLSELFLANGNHVIGVEPNDDMRIFAEKRLGKFPKFLSVKGRAERTSLETDRKSTRLNSSHPSISYAVFCLKKKKNKNI